MPLINHRALLKIKQSDFSKEKAPKINLPGKMFRWLSHVAGETQFRKLGTASQKDKQKNHASNRKVKKKLGISKSTYKSKRACSKSRLTKTRAAV